MFLIAVHSKGSWLSFLSRACACACAARDRVIALSICQSVSKSVSQSVSQWTQNTLYIQCRLHKDAKLDSHAHCYLQSIGNKSLLNRNNVRGAGSSECSSHLTVAINVDLLNPIPYQSAECQPHLQSELKALKTNASGHFSYSFANWL